MDAIEHSYKIILACNKHGALEQIYLDTGSFLENIKLPVSLNSLVASKSLSALGRFWLSIQEKSMEEDTLLTMDHNNKQIDFIFSGYLLKDTVLLCGNTELTPTKKALNEIMQINNEQANQIRLTEKKAENIRKEVEKKKINEVFLNDFTTLNNELINSKRELMRKNRKIELLNQELNAVNENMKTFTYSVSHDLKEPVRTVKSFLSLLQKKYGQSLDQKGQTYLDMALGGANRLSKMLADLLEYHQSTNFNTSEIVDLNEVFREVKKDLQNEIEERGAQVTSEKLPVVKGSSAGYRQVFQNLISNAMKFVDEGKAPVISIYAQENDTTHTLIFQDNGIGIPANQIENVFSLFKRLNSPQQYEGTGMGLAMVRKSIKRMGGEVWVESEEGKGSTFYVSINKTIET